MIFDDHLALGDRRLSERLVDVIYRCCGHLRGAQDLHPCVGAPRAENASSLGTSSALCFTRMAW